ncbi:MAG: uroporphyrinogen-III C-methyltransferase [Pseudohongiella sp.]|nr:uroporphyrinogen-III C-methyltransferase [Pseudohongiella sp.]|tara:strand:+ start:125795 stop:127180 length:1386 start_codon:yes stop_codon:yes gene_type:complete
MDYLPLFMNVTHRRCLLVGAGEVASRKAALLSRCGAHLVVVAPWISDEVRALAAQTELELHERPFQDGDLEEVDLVIAATDDPAVNIRVSELARQRRLPVNVVDQPDLCSFIVPAIVDRSPVVIAISTGGSSPVLTRRIKEQIEILLPAAYGRLAAMLGGWRSRVKERFESFSDRTRFWESLLSGVLPDKVLQGRDDEAIKLFENALKQGVDDAQNGEVYLVGAGPGDPDLLTLKALRLMYAADVVLFDRLVSPEIMKRVRPDAERVFVGKEARHHPVPQEEINDLLVRLAREGKKVLRLKGGDPFIFGRGGEEIDRLTEAGIPFQVVPGITAASGCSAYAGIPLTHRDFAQSVRFVTGHLKNDQPDLDWQALAAEQQTLVIYMGLLTLPLICEQLLSHGMSTDMPVAVVEQGTLPQQRVVKGTLTTIADKVAAAEVKAPAIIIIGQVVRLQNQLAWFGSD